jgi:hypothetical protein
MFFGPHASDHSTVGTFSVGQPLPPRAHSPPEIPVHQHTRRVRHGLPTGFLRVRDTHQLWALLSGTPLCEVHGSTRSGLHREGTLIDFAALEVRQDMEEAVQTPSPLLTNPPMPGTSTDRKDGCSREEADWCGADSEANGAS